MNTLPDTVSFSSPAFVIVVIALAILSVLLAVQRVSRSTIIACVGGAAVMLFAVTCGGKSRPQTIAHEAPVAPKAGKDWWRLGYDVAIPMARQWATQNGGTPKKEELEAAAQKMRTGLKIDAGQPAEDFERGFEYGFRDTFKAATTRAF